MSLEVHPTVSSGLNPRLHSQSSGWWGFCFHSLCSGIGIREKKGALGLASEGTAASKELDLQAKEFLPPKEGEPCWVSHFPFRACLSLRLNWLPTSRAPPGLRVRKGRWKSQPSHLIESRERQALSLLRFLFLFLIFSTPLIP